MTSIAESALVALLTSLIGGCDRSAQQESSFAAAPVVQAAAAEHNLRLPPEVTDETQLSGWFRGKVDFLVVPLELRPSKARFTGARVTPLLGHRAAALYYDAEPERFTVFMFDTPAVTPGPLVGTGSGTAGEATFGVINGYAVARIPRGQITYVVASDTSPDRLVALVRETMFP